MSIWQEKRLGEVASDVSYGYTESATFDRIGPKFLRITDITNDLINWNTVPYCKINDKDMVKYKLQYNDIVIARTGATTGINKQINKIIDAVFASYLIRFRINDRIANPKYVYHYLQTSAYKGFINNYISGSAQPGINATVLSKFKITLPDIKTQEKVADILSTYDDLIENNNWRIDILEQMAQEIYKEWFVRFRFPGHEKVKYKSIKMTNWVFGNDSITMIPNSWHIGNVSKLALFKRGSNLTSAKMINGNIPVISAGIQPSGYHNVANVFGQSITVSASGANAGYLLYHLNDIWASDCSYLQSEYIWFIYNSLKFLQPVLNNLQCGAAQPHVYPKQINKIPIIIPTNEILKQYCSKVEPIYEHIKNLKEKNQNLIKQRDLLLPRLMSGKLEI